MKVVIVGGVAGGASAAARLRRLDETAEIVVLEKGPYISYANCGLPYFVGGEITDPDALLVQTPEGFFTRYAIAVRVRHEVLGVDPAGKTVRVRDHAKGEEYTEGYDRLVLSPGARPVVPPLPGVEGERIFTLRTVPDTLAIDEFIKSKAPRHAVVVGGGYIGLEMAESLKRRGLGVTVVERGPQLLPPLDAEMAKVVRQYAQRDGGLEVRLNAAVTGFAPVGEVAATPGAEAPGGAPAQDSTGGPQAQATAPPKADGVPARQGSALAVQLAGGEELRTDMVLLAAGVKPDTAFLQGSGLQLNSRGAIVVDKHLRTSSPDIYALGDAAETRDFVTGLPATIQLAGPANRQGRVVADNLAGKDAIYLGAGGSAILRLFGLTVATTGLSERAAKQKGIECDKVYITAGNHAGYFPGVQSLTLKLVFATPSGRILGAQVLGGEGVDKRCDVIATAIRARFTAPELDEIDLCYSPPYGAAKDPVNMAGYVAENVLTGEVKQYFWQDYEKLPKDGSITLLDVRGKREIEKNGAIPGAVNIPLPHLRTSLDSLDRAKPVYVTCQSGLRSYTACRILMQAGFDAYNFAGGYGMYKALVQNG